ncbi:hypothetical protein MMAD_50840 [Mycolicibacterium madagascariense]|uniref:Uncharacterized protein n=1 Tax=Mycolicibacterium madagascariense TaxID=212765 RepID=A0A7I7XNH8_9MYCO|nr:hypothetical protein [Mycolicibacterium madagascariense]MCV7012721.1 hypothetical protein [Mycolicibacterium madagascariense]BBZ30789.1 hypothetical protein MMAD_50840 [Mycolicibacterium madagascariense]
MANFSASPGRSRLGRRLGLPFLAGTAALFIGSSGIASAAPTFDVEGYSTCTATTTPAPGEDYDAVVSDCCVQHAGVPTPTKFGMGCVAPVDAAGVDERPTIVLPVRPLPADKADDDLNGLIDMQLPGPPA